MAPPPPPPAPAPVPMPEPQNDIIFTKAAWLPPPMPAARLGHAPQGRWTMLYNGIPDEEPGARAAYPRRSRWLSSSTMEGVFRLRRARVSSGEVACGGILSPTNFRLPVIDGMKRA